MALPETPYRTSHDVTVQSEAELRKYLTANVGGIGCWSPVEAHASQPGFPDYAYTIDGVNGVCELKFGTNTKVPHLRVSQKVWMARNIECGGNPLIFLGVTDGYYQRFGLIHGNRAEQLYVAKNNAEWMMHCSITWPGRVVWSEFLTCLKEPGGLA